MSRPSIDQLDSNYDVIVIGSGLGGLTAANRLGTFGRKVLLLEQHVILGGLATWFKRKKDIFDVSLHGFPIGMKKTCRKYWSKAIADRIVQLKRIVFDNPQFSLETTFTQEDFIRIITEEFQIPEQTIEAFFKEVRAMDFFDDQSETTRELFNRYFPGRSDVFRLLMEPIAYANGSTLDEPAITYGIVFSNFMSKGVYTVEGGTDWLIQEMERELIKNGVTICTCAKVEKILTTNGKVTGVRVNGREISATSVVSNANLKATVEHLVDPNALPPEFLEKSSQMRLSTSSSQVYIGLKDGVELPDIGDLLFTSTAPHFDSNMLCDRHATSRTYSVYYPSTRPGHGRSTIVASMNARYDDWAKLDPEEYAFAKQEMIDETLNALENYVPGVHEMVGYTEAATPRTFERYTGHLLGASFGTKFEGLEISSKLPEAIPGLFHTGSAAIIMSGWLGAANYGAIVANNVDTYLDTIS